MPASQPNRDRQRKIDTQAGRQIDRLTDRHLDRRTDRQMERSTYRQTQTYREANIPATIILISLCFGV